MKKLLLVAGLLVCHCFYASIEKVNEAVYPESIFNKDALQSDACYKDIVKIKAEYQQNLYAVEQSLQEIFEIETSELYQLNKYYELEKKGDEGIQDLIEGRSLNKAYAILDQYQQVDNANGLDCDQRVQMKRLQASLQAIANPGSLHFELDSIYQQIASDCIAYQTSMSIGYENGMDTAIDQLNYIATQKKIKMNQQSMLEDILKNMDKLTQKVVTQENIHKFVGVPFDPKVAVALQSLYRMRQVKNGQKLIDLKRAFQERVEQEKKLAKKVDKKKRRIAAQEQRDALLKEQKKADKVKKEQETNFKKEQLALHKEQLEIQREQKIAIQLKNKQLKETAIHKKIVGEIIDFVVEEAVIVGEHKIRDQQIIVNKAKLCQERKENARLSHRQSCIEQGIEGNDLEVEMELYDVEVDIAESKTAAEHLSGFQKVLKPSTLDDIDSWSDFIQIITELQEYAQDLVVNDVQKTIVDKLITKLFDELYAQYGNNDNDYDYLCRMVQMKNGLIEKLNQAIEATKNDTTLEEDAKTCRLKELTDRMYEESLSFDEAVKAKNMFWIMTKLRGLQVFGGVFQKQSVDLPLERYSHLLADEFYKKDAVWKNKLDLCRKYVFDILQKESCIEASDYQLYIQEKYIEMGVPSKDVKLVAFDAAYSIHNMLHYHRYKSDSDLQKELFNYLYHRYPSYSLRLVTEMTKLNFIFYILLRTVSSTFY